MPSLKAAQMLRGPHSRQWWPPRRWPPWTCRPALTAAHLHAAPTRRAARWMGPPPWERLRSCPSTGQPRRMRPHSSSPARTASQRPRLRAGRGAGVETTCCCWALSNTTPAPAPALWLLRWRGQASPGRRRLSPRRRCWHAWRPWRRALRRRTASPLQVTAPRHRGAHPPRRAVCAPWPAWPSRRGRSRGRCPPHLLLRRGR